MRRWKVKSGKLSSDEVIDDLAIENYSILFYSLCQMSGMHTVFTCGLTEVKTCIHSCFSMAQAAVIDKCMMCLSSLSMNDLFLNVHSVVVTKQHLYFSSNIHKRETGNGRNCRVKVMALNKTPRMAEYFKTELTEAGGHANMLALSVFNIEAPFYYGQLDVFEECRLTMADISAGQMG